MRICRCNEGADGVDMMMMKLMMMMRMMIMVMLMILMTMRLMISPPTSSQVVRVRILAHVS